LRIEKDWGDKKMLNEFAVIKWSALLNKQQRASCGH